MSKVSDVITFKGIEKSNDNFTGLLVFLVDDQHIGVAAGVRLFYDLLDANRFALYVVGIRNHQRKFAAKRPGHLYQEIYTL